MSTTKSGSYTTLDSCGTIELGQDAYLRNLRKDFGVATLKHLACFNQIS